ncbi:hypothetical protein HYC85_024560 [Camellia sinensis]|uniref:Helicase ATP-binding domain-containing protein n=1 Tax=Camellia sinensis TaxID=4442 RepID=A0A7J7GCC4_CAMSI|nr:hypothetical protein HYC85_024560 [Camellia sinensis]
MSEKEKMDKENTQRQSSEPEEKNKEREVTTEREDGRKETEETNARKEHFHPLTSIQNTAHCKHSYNPKRVAVRPRQGFEQLDRFDSLSWNSSLSVNDDPFSISVGSSELEGGFLSLEEIDESEYGFEIPKPERENKKKRTKENKNEKKRKQSEVEDERGGEVEAVSEEKDNKVKRKKKKKKKKKKNKDAKYSEENEEPTAEKGEAAEKLLQVVTDHLNEVAKGTNFRVVPIVGGMSTEKQERLLKARPKIVVGTPGRLWELMSGGELHLIEVSANANYRLVYMCKGFMSALHQHSIIIVTLCCVH